MKIHACSRTAVVLGVLFACAACSGPVEILPELTFREANEVVVLFASQGVTASLQKVEGEEGITYTVMVPPEDEMTARRLLSMHGLPRQRHPGYAEATAKTGMIPSAGDEKMKLLAAKQGEINNALEAIDDVLEAHTIINLPDYDSLAEGPPQPPTASVVIRLRQVRDASGKVQEPEIDEDKIQRIVANAVQGLDPQMVEIEVDKRTSDQPKVKKAGAATSSSGSSKEGMFKILAFGALGLVVVLAVLLILAGKQKKDLKRRVFAMQRQLSEGTSG
jgi:type III secretion system YscJ/HrcJ family lipoprotein